MRPVNLIAFAILVATSSVFGASECILKIDEVPPKGITQVWSPLFHACWDKLGEIQEGELEKVLPPNALITDLEAFQWEVKEVMPQDGYAVFAGPATADFARQTAAAIKKQFDVEIDPSRIPTIPQGKAAYGILIRDMKFEKKFSRSQKSGLEFRTRTDDTHVVEFFGTAGKQSDDYRNYVKVLYYEADPSSFVLSIATEREDEKLIVYRPDQECSFRLAIERVKKAMESPLSGTYGSLKDGSLHRDDVVKIPYVTVDADTDFAGQLGGALHYAGNALPWRVVAAFQHTRFELSEAGAKVRIESGLVMEPFGGPPKPPPIVPRSFVCDQGFFLFLWKTDADWPYLALWVDGADGLNSFPNRKGM